MLSHTYDNLSIKTGKNNKFKHIDSLLYLRSFINLTITEQNNFFAFFVVNVFLSMNIIHILIRKGVIKGA